ncbi:MAG: L-threonylcarbamoyladenylate synthase [Bacteroidota bacterium]
MATIGSNLLHAQNLLEASGVVAMPTETVYGLAGNAYDEAAVLKIFHIKQRPSFDPLIVHSSSLEKLQKFVKDLPQKAFALARRFWPGPLTLVLEKEMIIPDIVTSGLASVAVRVPQHALALQLLHQLDFPLAAPSANPFGYISPTTSQHVQQQLGDRIPYILEGGPCTVGIESTIVGFVAQQPILYRPGGVSLEAIEQVIGPVQVVHKEAHHPQAPGMLAHHYAPKKPLVLGELSEMLAQYATQRVGLLSFQKPCPDIALDRQVVLTPTGSLEIAAQRLFAALRTLDSLPIDVILATLVPNTGIGRAINDRLKKAATPQISF